MDEQVIAVMVLDVEGHTLDVNIPMDRGQMTSLVQEGLGVEAPSEAEVTFVNSELPILSADLGADADMLNDLASLAAGLTDEQREAAELYWDNVVSVSEQDRFQAAANVLMQASEIEQWHAYDYYAPEAGWPSPLSSIEKYGRSWYESKYRVPTVAHYNYDLELYGRRNSDDVRLYDEGYLELSVDWPDIESYDRGVMNDDLEGTALPEVLEDWQKVSIVARSLYNGEEFKATLPMNPTEALDLEEAATLGEKHDYEIVEIEDGGVLDRLGIDATAHSYERVETLNGLLIMAATRLNANGNDYERVRALINEQASPTYLDVAGAIAGVEEIPYYAYDFPNIDAHDLASMSKEEKWGRTYYDAQAEAGELSEGKKGYEELIDIDFDIKTYGLDHDVTLGDGGYIDAYSGDELNLTFYDDEEIADAAKEAREKIGIADTPAPPSIEQPVARPNIPAPSEPYATQFRLLSRMRSDFDYVLGEGGVGALRMIWASDGPASQIAYMRRLLAEIPEEYAPEWISVADIDDYEQRINALVAEQNSELAGRSESSLEAEALDEAERIMEDLIEETPGDEPVLSEREVREMMEDAAMGRGEEPPNAVPDALEELNRRVHEIDRAIVFAEIPETTYSLGIAEVSVDRSPSSETSYYVIYDSEKRHPFGHSEGLVRPAVEDLPLIFNAVARHAPDAPWVKWGFREITPWGFKDDGTPYSASEYREGTGATEIEELQPVMSYREGLSISEALAEVPNAPVSQIEIPIINAVQEGIRARVQGYSAYGSFEEDWRGDFLVIGEPTNNGYVYKNPYAFEERGSDAEIDIAYIANAAWEERIEADENGYVRVKDMDPEDVYTYARILEACSGSRRMAERVFAELDWQHPETLYDENMRMFAEDWEDADKRVVMERQPEEVQLYVECKLRERGISGEELIRAMGMTRAGDLLGLVEYPAVEEKTLAEEMNRLNRIARPWAIFAEPVPEGHLVGAVDVLVDTEVPDQKVAVRVIYDWDARPMGPNADDPDYEPYAGDWAVVSAAVEAAFPGRSYEDSGWIDAETLESVLDGAKFPTTRVSEVLTANRDAATVLASATENPGAENLSDELQESQVKQPEWKPGSIAVGRTTGMPYVVLAVTEDGRLRLGADLSIYDSDMFEQGGQVDEALVESYREGFDDGSALARALAEATGRPEVGESRIEDLAKEQLVKPSNEIRSEKTSSEDKGPWKVGSIAIGRQSGYAFVVMDVTEDGRLLLGADAYVASPDMFEYGGQVPDQVMDDIRSGSITEEELQEVLGEIREKAEREALTGPESEQPTWKIGSIAMDRDTRESHLVTGLTASGNILIGYDMEPVNAAAYQNVGEVDEEIALGYRNGTIDNDGKNRAMAAAMSEYVTSSRDAGDLTEEEIADIERGFEEDFGDLYVRAMAEEHDVVSADNDELVEADEIPRIDPERSGWYVNGRSGWEFHTYFKGENIGGDSYAICGIEMSPSGSFVAIVELNGEQRLDLSPKSSFPTFNRAREAGMLSLGSALGLAPEVLAPYVHGEVAPDPYPETWARDESWEMTVERIMAKYGFDPDTEYVRTYPDGQWEALYYNPQGNEERGQIVQAWGGDLAAALAEYDPENVQWISTIDGRDNDQLHDWPEDMESILVDFMRHRQEFVGFAEGEFEAQHEYLVEQEAYLESMRTLDTERSDIFEDVPGREYQMVAVSVGDEESEHAYVANIKLREDGWSVGVTYDNGALNRESNGIASFEEAREYAMRMFRAGGRYSTEALNDFEGFQKEFPAVDAESQDSGWRSYESVLMNDEWGWEVSPAGVGRLMDQNGEIYAEIHPDRKQVIFRDEPIPGATTWTVDNDDVRLVLEAYTIQEAGFEFEPPEGATFDSLIYDVTKSLAKEDDLIPPRLTGAFEPLSSHERFANDLDELFEAYDNNLRFSPLETIYISDTPGILVSLGMEQRPIHLNALHALNIIAPKNERNSHHHGITREEMASLPDLIARPAVITDALNGATSSDAVVLVLPDVDSDNQPLLAVIHPNEEAQYELETINMNRLASVYGKRNAENFLTNAAEQGKVLYIDKKETEELSKVSQLQLLKSLAGLPFNEIIRRSSVIDKAEGRGVSTTVAGIDDVPKIDAMKVIEEANEQLRAEQSAEIEESLTESDVLQSREGVVKHEDPTLADKLKAAVVGALAWTVVAAPVDAEEVQTPTGTYIVQASDDLIDLKERLTRSLDETLPAGWVVEDVAPSKDVLALEMTISSGDVDVELGVVAPRGKTTTTEENLDDLSSRLLEAAAEAMVGELAADAYISSTRRQDAKDALGRENLDIIDAASATVETQRRGQTAYSHVGENILVQTGGDPQLYTRLAARNGEDFFADDNGREVVSLKNGSIVEGEEAASRMNEMLAAYANHPNPGTVEFQNEFTYISTTLQESEFTPTEERSAIVKDDQNNRGFFRRMREALGSRRQEKESETRKQSEQRNDEEAATQTAVLASALAAASAMEAPVAAVAEIQSKDNSRRKVEVVGYTAKEAAKSVTAKSDEIEARAGAAKVKKAAPAPQQAQKRQ